MSVVHFHSHVTATSLELPARFAQVEEDDTSVLYADLGDDGRWPSTDPRSPRLRVSVVAVVEPETPASERHAAVRAVADGFAGTEGSTLARLERVVDEEPVATVTLRQREGGYLHLSAASTARRVVTLVGVTPDEDLLPAFDAAVASLRLVEL